MRENFKSRSADRVRRKRKSNMSLYYGTVLFIAAVIFAVLSLTVFFKVETVIVNGSSVYDAEDIIAASGIEGGDNMIRKNMGRAAEKITEQLIYIETAEIKRKLPSSVEITVTPCIETACFENEDGFLIVSRSGKILRHTEEPPAGMLVFYGTDPAEGMDAGLKFASEEENKTEVIYELLKKSEDGFAANITSFDVTDRLNISCVYEDRIDIELGVVSDIDYKFRLAEVIISTKISPDAEGLLRMLEKGGQFLSKADLEQIEEIRRVNRENALNASTETSASETEVPENSDTTATTKLNFE